MKKKDEIAEWMKNHKTEIIVTGVVIVGTVLLIRNRKAIRGLFKTAEPVIPDIIKIEPIAEAAVVPAISKDILDNLTGHKLTARDLGHKVWCTAQDINKRIVDAGLAVRLPNGGYEMTEAGHLFGEETWKIAASGHSFTNIEWDEKILEVIFSPEELLDIAARQERVRQI